MADQSKPQAVLYQGSEPLQVPIDTILHAMKAILLGRKEEEFLANCLPLEDRGNLLVQPALANLVKTFIQENELFTLSPEALEIMTSPPHKRCWPRRG
jgi:hypothetical protein